MDWLSNALSVYVLFLVPSLSIDNIDKFLPLFLPCQIDLQHLKRPIHVRRPQPTDMRRDDHIRRVPQRIVVRQRFGVRNIQRRASQPAILRSLLQRLYQIRLLQDLAPTDVRNERISRLAQNLKLLFAQEMRRLLRQRHADEQMVDILSQELVQLRLLQPAEPRAGNIPFRIARPRHDEATIPLTLLRVPRTGRVRDDIHAHRLRYPSDLPADTAVPQHAEPLAHHVADVHQVGVVVAFAPVVVFLPLVEFGVAV